MKRNAAVLKALRILSSVMLIYCKTLWFMKDKIQVFIPQICVPAILSEWRNLFWIKSLNVQVFKYLLKVILVATHLLMLLMKIKTGIRYNVGNQAKERISKWVFLENKARQFSEKRIFLTHWYAHARVSGFMYVCKVLEIFVHVLCEWHLPQ